MNHRYRTHFIFVLVIIGLLYINFRYYRQPLTKTNDTSEEKIVSEKNIDESHILSVIDGDSITATVEGKNETIRLIGIDSPEYRKDGAEGDCYYAEATSRMSELVLGKTVTIASDPTQDNRDTYERILRYVFLPDGRNAGEIMVREGFAREYTYLGRKYLYYEKFREAETIAKNAHLGIWSEMCR